MSKKNINHQNEFCPYMCPIKISKKNKDENKKNYHPIKRFRILSSYAFDQKEKFILIDEPNFCNIINEYHIEKKINQSPEALSEYHTPNCIENLPVLSMLTGDPSG